MKIKDINGYQVEIPDLDRAIELAEFFKDCQHTPPQPIDAERQAYWEDMHKKLLKEKSKREKRNEQSRR